MHHNEQEFGAPPPQRYSAGLHLHAVAIHAAQITTIRKHTSQYGTASGTGWELFFSVLTRVNVKFNHPVNDHVSNVVTF